MNEKLEQLINDLPEQLQQEAKKCTSLEELNEFLADNDIELSEDVLEAVAGGIAAGCGEEYYCKKCGTTVKKRKSVATYYYPCPVCKKKYSADRICVRPVTSGEAAPDTDNVTIADNDLISE